MESINVMQHTIRIMPTITNQWIAKIVLRDTKDIVVGEHYTAPCDDVEQILSLALSTIRQLTNDKYVYAQAERMEKNLK